MESATPRSARLNHTIDSSEQSIAWNEAASNHDPESLFEEISGLSVGALWREADADKVSLAKPELARVLVAIGAKYNCGLPPETRPTRAQAAAFWRGLNLRDLALAQACALGRDIAWRIFVERYRDPLTQAAMGITGSASLGQELADSLHSEMFGLASRDGERRSPIASYAGRGSLMGFLRSSLAQRYVDHHRRTKRETPIDRNDFPSAPQHPLPAPDVLARLIAALALTLKSIDAEERFLLSAWYLDQRTLIEIARVLRVHEATVSRKIKRVTSKLRKELLDRLRAAGMSRAAAEEALGTDPRDVAINIRTLLQSSTPDAFLEHGLSADSNQG